MRLLVEWLLYTNSASFSGILGVIGALILPILGGIFPMLILAASRRKGDYLPKRTFGFLGNPLVLTTVYLIYLSSLFAYGVFIWDDPIKRLLAIGTGFVVLIITYLVIRQGGFVERVVVELRVELSDTGERTTLTLVNAGKSLTGKFKLLYANEERSGQGNEIEIPSYKKLKTIFIEFPLVSAKEIKVWLHRVTPEGNSEPISAAVRIKGNGDGAAIQLDPKTGQVILLLTSQLDELEITSL